MTPHGKQSNQRQAVNKTFEKTTHYVSDTICPKLSRFHRVQQSTITAVNCSHTYQYSDS